MVTIAVGSTNPTKIGAVEDAFHTAFDTARVTGISVPSGVSEMPMSDAECLSGAANRAHAARKKLDTDFGVGLEGGVNEEASGLMILGWVVIIHRNGTRSEACTAKIPLPEGMAKEIRAGKELGPLVSQMTGDLAINRKGGATGMLSAGLVSRRDKFSQAIKYALSPYVTPEVY